AQKKLGEADEILRSDFFLVATSEAFKDAARHLISESYCKIHQRIDIKDLSKRLGLSEDEGEKWIVNLIRDTRVDAKIDYKEGTVVMNHPPQSVYQQVIERTKGGFFRTQVLSAAVARREIMSASLAPECNEVKERYDSCFLKWYSEKYLRGTATTDECEPLFAKYKQCLGRALKERGIDKMLDEARADNRENDLENMKPSN
ncbi:hypothetical protein KCU78_g19930, partial [Aureobasidium melanogenum]